MEVLAGFSLGAVAGRAPGANSAVSVISAIAAEGWTAQAATPATAIGVSIPVLRAGYDALGNAVTVADEIKITTRLREAYPAQATLTADKVVLSDFIYAGDTIAGVTNMSTRPAPKPIAAWLNRDLEICKASTFTARLAVAHAHARAGRPVAAVRFRASDGATAVEALVSSMSATSHSASGLSVPHFAGVLDFSGFANGAAITIDAVIYPWIGTTFTLSTDADAYPSPNLTTLRVLNDRSGAYGTAYAYVDATLGTASGVASATAATAAAAPFQTMAQAAAAIRAFNNTTYGRNYTDAGVIRLLAGVHAVSASMGSASPTLDWPLTIEAAEAGARETTFVTDTGASTQTSIPAKAVFRNLTFRRSVTGNIIGIDNAAANLSYTNMMAFEGCVFDANGAGTYAGWIYRTGRGYFIDCTQISDCGQAAITGVVNKAVRAIGCNGAFVSGATSFGALGCIAPTMAAPITGLAATTGRVATNGPLWGWSHLTQAINAQRVVGQTTATAERGIGLVGCVFEQLSGDTGPAVYVSADSSVTVQQNILFQCCTVAGSRTNWLYQDTGTATVAKSGFMRFVVQEYRNTKCDVFGANANLIGNWPAVFNVGSRANCARLGDNGGNAVTGTGNWLGEVTAAGDVYGSVASPVVANWANDQSFFGGNAGGGNYTPGSGNALPRIPAGLAPYPLDMKGRAIGNDGTALVGALQPG